MRVHPGSPWVFAYVLRCATHYHRYTLAQRMLNKESRLLNSYQ